MCLIFGEIDKAKTEDLIKKHTKSGKPIIGWKLFTLLDNGRLMSPHQHIIWNRRQEKGLQYIRSNRESTILDPIELFSGNISYGIHTFLTREAARGRKGLGQVIYKVHIKPEDLIMVDFAPYKEIVATKIKLVERVY